MLQDKPPLLIQEKPILFGVERTGERGAGVVTLNRAAQLNALNLECYRLLDMQLKKWATDPEIAFVLIEAKGDKAFCAGGDVKRLILGIKESGLSVAKDFFAAEYFVDSMIHNFPKPIIALTHGITMGGGIGLTRGAPFRIVCENTTMAMPEISIGLFPDVGASRFLHDLPDEVGLFLAMTGFRILGRECIDLNLGTHFCETPRIRKMRSDLLRLPFQERASINIEILRAYFDKALPKNDESLMSKILRNLKKRLKTNNYQEYRQSILNCNLSMEVKRVCSDKTMQDELLSRLNIAIETFKWGSPTAKQVFFAAYNKHKSYTMDAALIAEWDMAIQFSKGGDFHEGVRARLIEKALKPTWNPVDDDIDIPVTKYFLSGEENPLPDLIKNRGF